MAYSSENHSQEGAQVSLKPSVRRGPSRLAYPSDPLTQGEKASNWRGVLPLLASRTSGVPGSAFGLWSAHVPWRVTAPQAGAGHVRAAARLYILSWRLASLNANTLPEKRSFRWLPCRSPTRSRLRPILYNRLGHRKEDPICLRS